MASYKTQDFLGRALSVMAAADSAAVVVSAPNGVDQVVELDEALMEINHYDTVPAGLQNTLVSRFKYNHDKD